MAHQMMGPQVAMLPDGKRLHLNHGPIDLIIEAFGNKQAITKAYEQAVRRFDGLLEELVEELPVLRSPKAQDPKGIIAKRMAQAVRPHVGFVTPMASVAGAVADEVLAAMIKGRHLTRAYVNNGGDCALHLTAGQSLALGISGPGGEITLGHADPVRGVATSGWRGRSHSLGIADAVTVLASTAAQADVAATLIANAVNLQGHPSILREPACVLDPDSDLCARLVTVEVGALSELEVERALQAGLDLAKSMKRRNLIVDAALFLNGRSVQTAPERKLLDA